MFSMPLKLFKIGYRQVLRDGMLLILIPAPFLMGAALRVLLPFVDGMMQEQIGITLVPWYPVSDALVLTMTPVMTAMICAFVILEERDEGISMYYNITPASGPSYLMARIALPMIWGFLSTVLVIRIFAFGHYDPLILLTSSLIGTLQGVIVSMFLVTVAGNKVEGLALAKLSNIFVMGFVIPWVIHSPVRLIFGILPGFWIGAMLKAQSLDLLTLTMYGLAGLISCGIFMTLLTNMFLRRIS